MEEAEQLCDYIIIIDNGKILKEGTLNKLLREDGSEKIIEFTLEGPNDFNGLFQNSGYNVSWDDAKDVGVLIINSVEDELPHFLNYLKEKNLRLKNFESRKRTLDDLFITLTGRHLNE